MLQYNQPSIQHSLFIFSQLIKAFQLLLGKLLSLLKYVMYLTLNIEYTLSIEKGQRRKMAYMKLGFILLLAILSLSSSLKVYSRSIPSTDLSKKVGLQYKNSKLNEGIYWKKGLTVCIRFKYKQLGTRYHEGKCFVLHWTIKFNACFIHHSVGC